VLIAENEQTEEDVTLHTKLWGRPINYSSSARSNSYRFWSGVCQVKFNLQTVPSRFVCHRATYPWVFYRSRSCPDGCVNSTIFHRFLIAIKRVSGDVNHPAGF
jgi:hypothetical protein